MATAKPTPRPEKRIIKPKAYDYHEMMDFLEEKYKFVARDYFDTHSHFDAWAKKHKKPKKDRAGKDWGSSQIFWAEYVAAPDGEAQRPPYCDFWHWLLKQNDEICNDSQITFCAKEWLDEVTAEGDVADEWIKTILGYIIAEFGDEFDVHIEW